MGGNIRDMRNEKGQFVRGLAPRLGVVARMDHSGLGYQTKALVEMLKPDKVLVVDSSEFREGMKQHPEWYENYNTVFSGMPSFLEYEEFLKDIDVMLTCETPYVYEAWNWARMAGVKTFCQPNWELFDGLVQPNMPHPDVYMMPSYWHLEEMQELFPKTVYLPPPTPDLKEARAVNLRRTGKRRFVHIGGITAVYDRNGWAALRDCLEETTADFELVVYSQTEITGLADPRVKYHIFDVENQEDLYRNFDALLLPRRYGGLCLPMNEALMAGLPVIMPDVSPNNKILPAKWLLPATVTATFEGRSTIDVYSVDGLAKKIDELCEMTDVEMLAQKYQAHDIARGYYSFKKLFPKYRRLLTTLE